MTRNRSVCQYVRDEHEDEFQEVLRLTADKRVEHGYVISGDPGDTRTSNIIAGTVDNIDDLTGELSAGHYPVTVLVHTHPFGDVILSEADWRTFLMELGLYGTADDFPEGWRRGFVVASPKEDGTFLVRGVELTEQALGFTPEQQWMWVEDSFETVKNWTAITDGGFDEMLDAIGPRVTGCTNTFDG